MKLIDIKCKRCGSILKIDSNSKTVKCKYCKAQYMIDDETVKVKLNDMENSGYEFEKGKIRAKEEHKNDRKSNSKIKSILVILLYILYQSNFLIALISDFGIKLTSLPKWIKMIILVINDLIYVFIILYMFRKEIKNGLKEVKKDFPRLATLSLNCWIIGSLIMTTSSIIISYITKQNTSNNEELVRQSIKMAPLYMLFTCSIVAPVLEEMTFRRALKGLINNKWLFILVSGLGFGLLHVIGSGFKNPLDFLYVIPYGSMGCAFAYLLTKTNNITLPIMVHMLHNTILVLIQILRR